MIKGGVAMRHTRLSNSRVFVFCGLATAFCLIGGMILGGALSAIVNERLPAHSTDAVNILLSAIPALGGVFTGGAAWGWSISRITRSGESKRMAWAGALGFGPIAILAALGLTVLESIIVEQQQGPQLPIHNVFTMLFVPASAVVSGVGGYAIAVGARVTQAVKLGLTIALAGGVAFLLVNLLLDSLGWRVGAPGAADRATMLITTFSGCFAAAVVGGGVMGVNIFVGANREVEQ